MDWSRKKENFLNNLGNRIRNFSSNRKQNYLPLRIPILINTIHITEASTQTLPINLNNNGVTAKTNSTRRRKYRHRFNKCLKELMEKYPPIPAHEYLVCKEEKSIQSCYSSILNEEINSSIWSKLLESRENLSKLNQTLEDLDQRLEYLSMNICFKCQEKEILFE